MGNKKRQKSLTRHKQMKQEKQIISIFVVCLIVIIGGVFFLFQRKCDCVNGTAYKKCLEDDTFTNPEDHYCKACNDGYYLVPHGEDKKCVKESQLKCEITHPDASADGNGCALIMKIYK